MAEAEADAVRRSASVARGHCHRAGSWRLIRRPQTLAASRKCHLRVRAFCHRLAQGIIDSPPVERAQGVAFTWRGPKHVVDDRDQAVE
ncbi:MAG: hypothetical protein QOF46_3641 [Paraburkholderia sp.]|jgi:hypothetical protein|nr:hypothetical protein [Paraburkholderia sp.]